MSEPYVSASFQKLTAQTATFSFFAALFWELSDGLPPSDEIITYSSIILAVAGTSYIFINREQDTGNGSYLFRYSDWLITTPLLLLTLWSFARRFGYQASPATVITYDIGMLVLGFAGDTLVRSKNYDAKTSYLEWFFYISSTVFLALIIYEVIKLEKFLLSAGVSEARQLTNYFKFGWPGYAIANVIPNPDIKFTTYNVLDVINKVGFAISMRSVMQKYPTLFPLRKDRRLNNQAFL
jgi:bacteriorhodopsin